MMRSPETPSVASSAVRFGPFLFDASRRLLSESGTPIRLGSRAFEILKLLIERAGQFVSKNEIIARVWPTTVVAENNLRVHVASLRRALGDGHSGRRYIVSAQGRGYSFVGVLLSDPSVSVVAPEATARQHNLPVLLSRVVGRASEIQALGRLIQHQRLLTIVGAAGVGKTTTALAVAKEVLHGFRDGVHFVDLAAVRTEQAIGNAFAVAFGISLAKEAPAADLWHFIRDREILLLIDNCEQVIAGIASLVEGVLKHTTKLHILATSREPLNAQGEWRYRIAPLGVPPDEPGVLMATSAREYPAVQLFVERAIAGGLPFKLTDANTEKVARICRALDGLPLAIELAAARVGLLGINELTARVHEHVSQDAPSRRTTAPRHQTLRATFDWSFDLLNPAERLAFRRLAIFNGAFTIDTATGLIAHGPVGQDDASNAVMGLAEKSLIVTDATGTTLRHRFLNTVRAYAFEKLRPDPDFCLIQRWHAEQILRLMRQAELGWESLDRADWISAYGYAIDDVRAALDWAFSPEGDAELGASLTSIAVPFGLQLGLVEEFRARIAQAIYWVTTGTANLPETATRLRETLAHLSMQDSDHTRAADEATRDPLDLIQSPKCQIAPLLRKSLYQIDGGAYDEAVSTAARLGSVARTFADTLAVLTADRLAAQAYHFRGDHALARAYAERVLDHPAKSIPVAYVPVQTDRRMWMRIVLARALWMEGKPEQASGMIAEALDLAKSDSPFALCQALAIGAGPIAFWNGELAEARRHAELLISEANRHKLSHWKMYGEWFERALAAETSIEHSAGGSPGAGIGSNPIPIGGLLRDTIITINPWIVGVDLSGLRATGWCAAELLRVKGESLVRGAAAGYESPAEKLFAESLQVADRQRALSWELRSSLSLSLLWSNQGKKKQARELLGRVTARFSEGRDTRDLAGARKALENLS